MFKQHNIITAVEIGTSKVCVLIGEYTEDELIVIGKGAVPSDGAVVKGEITSMDLIIEKLIDAMEQADLQSGHELNNSAMYVMTVTGCDMSSLLSEGTAFVQNEEHRITENEICEAVSNARICNLGVDRLAINSFDAYYMIDGTRRSSQPLYQRASTLKAYSHIIHGNSNRLENFSVILHDAGIDYTPEMIFNPIADIFGLLSSDEEENGTLLIDFGAGSTEYVVICNNGLLASGVIGIGFEHVVNDVAIGLNLPVNYCRKLLTDGTLEKYTRENVQFIECRTNSGSVRKIPLESFNRIADARIRELFELIRNKLWKESFWNNLAAGCVLTGGGVKFFQTKTIADQVTELPSRIGVPFNAKSTVPPELNDPAYSTVYGALQYGYKRAIQDNSRNSSFGNNLKDKISGFGDTIARTLKNLRNSMNI